MQEEIKMNNFANKGFFKWFLSTIDNDWHVCLRCVDCGQGYDILKDVSKEKLAKLHNSYYTGIDRWLCIHCGSGHNRLVTWIGRSSKDKLYWEWLPKEKLPADLITGEARTDFEAAVAAEVEKQLEKRIDAEFESRVRAAVEVELELMKVIKKTFQ